MAPSASNVTAERRPIEFAAAPASRLWIAVCFAVGGAILAASLAGGLGELLLSLERQALEAIVQPKVS
ncbi:hypothetical protein L6R52_37005 [Myxococcota bacterium]|nr:hypothetical protein [Myxococcota bacterium]